MTGTTGGDDKKGICESRFWMPAMSRGILEDVFLVYTVMIPRSNIKEAISKGRNQVASGRRKGLQIVRLKDRAVKSE